MALKVVIPQDITEAGKKYLRDHGYEIVIGDGAIDAASMKKVVAPADGILIRTALLTPEIIDAAPRLKVIGRHGVGVDNIDLDYCAKKGIWVTNAPTSNSNSVAEHTVGFLVAAAHQFAYMDRQTRAGNWEARNKAKCVDLLGKTLGVVGLGRIGRMVAQKCQAAFDMKVIGYDAMLTPDKYPAGVTPASVEEIFKQADFVTMHVPATAETRGMVNKKLLALMKPGAYFINCARGEVVDEADLHECLSARKIAGAALDVFGVEQAKADHPLFKLDNVTVTPHNAALTQESMDRMGLHAAMGIHSVLSGQKPEWPANKPV